MERHTPDRRRRDEPVITPATDIGARRSNGPRSHHNADTADALGAQDPTGGFTRRVIERRHRADRELTGRALRLGLAAVAVVVFVRGLDKLMATSGQHHDVHATRHLGTFVAAYAVALAAVAHKPSRARSMLPVAVFVAGTLLITAIFDLSEGLTPLSRELLHLPEIAGALLVWRTARRLTSTAADPPSVGHTTPLLHVVE